VTARAGPSDVFVLDFDGVLIDSEPEVSQSAYDAAKDYWPDLFAKVDGAKRAGVLAGLRETRPVLVRGYESMVMARLILEDPNSVSSILADWESLLQAMLSGWGEDWQQLQQAFEQHRGDWLASDREGWLAMNQPYPGVAEALRYCEFPFYIASSKAAKRVSPLLKEQLGQDIPEDSPRLFASLLPPNEMKVETLRQIAARPICADTGARLHFVDDRLETLLAVRGSAGMDKWNLYLADWGYNTKEERMAAAGTPRIKVLNRPAFLELLKWGILMGVDDGCEPTAEEVAAGVAMQKKMHK